MKEITVAMVAEAIQNTRLNGRTYLGLKFFTFKEFNQAAEGQTVGYVLANEKATLRVASNLIKLLRED